jgi:hypothetical protein
VVNVLPQPQVTVVVWYCGWISAFMTTPAFWRSPGRLVLLAQQA